MLEKSAILMGLRAHLCFQHSKDCTKVEMGHVILQAFILLASAAATSLLRHIVEKCCNFSFVRVSTIFLSKPYSGYPDALGMHLSLF